MCALGGIFILTLPIPIVVNSFASYYKNRLWRNEVAYKKRQRAKKRREMELLMRDNLLNILTVPGNFVRNNFLRIHNFCNRKPPSRKIQGQPINFAFPSKIVLLMGFFNNFFKEYIFGFFQHEKELIFDL